MTVMSVVDFYFTINEPVLGELKDKGSKFKAYLFPVKSEESFKSQLNFIKEQEPNARHHCWAFILGESADFQKSNDDGEPRNTAGAPILRALVSSGLTNLACVVVRYFGGTKLGVPGLIAAYGGSAELAVANAPKIKRIISEELILSTSYEHMALVERMIKIYDADVVAREQRERVTYTLTIRRSLFGEAMDYVKKNHHITIHTDR
ncbi:MAG: YigZ family protein [Bacteroidetes bacterium]|nr:MAG: YigZ family protein [Bacteroidota bacterium]REK60894.1 MAG: YigZ family protein [Bacteroidota bacterium]